MHDPNLAALVCVAYACVGLTALLVVIVRRMAKGRTERRRDAWDRRSFRCPYCRTSGAPFIRRKVSTAGWVLFILFLWVFPLNLLWLLLTEEVYVCSDCGLRFGGG